jgi:nicotinamidase/pyrazinamidase
MEALILIDIQNDFMPGGTLAVRDADRVVPVANREAGSGRYGLIIATRDFHPAGHGSFASAHPGRKVGDKITLGGVPQTLWPDHCVQGTPGADFAPGLLTDRIDRTINLGTDRLVDGYSGFFDNAHERETGLHRQLQEKQVNTLTLLGLATDYCVYFTALDAVSLGYKTRVVVDGCRGVDLKPGDSERALKDLAARGIELV